MAIVPWRLLFHRNGGCWVFRFWGGINGGLEVFICLSEKERKEDGGGAWYFASGPPELVVRRGGEEDGGGTCMCERRKRSRRSWCRSSYSTRSDTQSAPPELSQLFDGICSNSVELLRLRGRELPEKWNIEDLIQAVMGEEALQIPGHLQDTYYDVLLR
ncbi:hypothetical protein HAX54_023372, partial [Datura stramonium]|nr:hypothetical protein [Datura stramonium]